MVFFLSFFTYLLLSIDIWHALGQHGLHIRFAASHPSILYLNISKQRKFAEKLRGSLVPGLVPKQAAISLQTSHNIYRHVPP